MYICKILHHISALDNIEMKKKKFNKSDNKFTKDGTMGRFLYTTRLYIRNT